MIFKFFIGTETIKMNYMGFNNISKQTLQNTTQIVLYSKTHHNRQCDTEEINIGSQVSQKIEWDQMTKTKRHHL